MKANASTVRKRKEEPIMNTRDTIAVTAEMANLNN
jgi:hypothetical protein